MHRGEVQEVTSKKRSYHGHEHDYFWSGQVLETPLSWEPQPSANVCNQIVLNMDDCQVGLKESEYSTDIIVPQ